MANTALRLLFLLLLGLPLPALALNSITILTSASSAPVNEFTEHFKNELAQNFNLKLPVKIISAEDAAASRLILSDEELLIAVGVQALEQAGKLDFKAPVLGVLIPQLSFEKILIDSKHSSRVFSAVLLDQPFSRQLALVKAALPAASNIGVLFGPASLPSSIGLQQAARLHNLGLVQENVNKAPDLMPKLRHVLENSSALLAVPDPAVYNRESVPTILLTSYRYQKPVIGFSQAYVRAGALAAVYSTPRQIAKQAAETVRQFTAKPQAGLPPPQAPKYFSVDINRQVARSLGIEIGDENALSETMLRIERLLP